MARIPFVDQKTCIGCGACVAVCPKVFELDGSGKSRVKNPSGDTEKNIQNAMDVCPVQAITWKE